MWQIISLFIRPIPMLIGVFLFGMIVLNKKIQINIKNFFILLLLIITVQTITYLNFTGLLKTIILAISNSLFYKYTFKISMKKSIFLTFLYMILLMIAELVELYILTQFLGMSREFCYETYAGSLISGALVTLLFIPIALLLREILRKLINENLENNTKIIIYSILIFGCAGMFFYTLIRKFRFQDDIALYVVTIGVLIGILFSLLKQTIENNKLTREYDQLLKFMTTYENEIEKQRILRHEVKNEFRTIRAKICDRQENKEIIEYIDEIVNDKYEVNQEKYAKFGYLPPNGIKGLCYFKTQEAEDRGIRVNINISKRVEKSTVYNLNIKQQRDFGRILGVFLDNAIEASVESEEKQIGIEAYINTEKEFKIIISNTYSNEIDKNKIGKEKFSTKGKNRGHGLLLVKQLTENNRIFELKTNIQGGIYTQTIIIKQK